MHVRACTKKTLYVIVIRIVVIAARPHQLWGQPWMRN
jgi:hypothetical protein